MQKLSHLALSDEGFVFDPATGDSFHVNQTGLRILEGVREGQDQEGIARTLAQEFAVALDDAKRDVADFCGRLKTFGLL